MAALDNNDPDLESLRLAVFKSLKSKKSPDSTTSNAVESKDEDLDLLRKVALQSKRQNGTVNHKPFHREISDRKLPFESKKFNRNARPGNANLIVIQPQEEETPPPSTFKLSRPQDVYLDSLSRSPQQPRTKGNDKFSRFESSSSSESESDDYSDTESSISEKLSETSESNRSPVEEEKANENADEDVLVLQPDESFDEHIEKTVEEVKNCDNKVSSVSESKQKPVKNDERTLKKDTLVHQRKRERHSDTRQNSSHDRSKRRHKDDSERSARRKNRKHEHERNDSELADERRRQRKTRDRRNVDLVPKEKTDSSQRSRNEDGRVKLNSILSKPEASDDRKSSYRSSRNGSNRSKSVERNSRVSERLDLREKLQSRKRLNESKEEDKDEENHIEIKRRSRGVSEEGSRKSESKSKSPPIKSVLSVVKVTNLPSDNICHKKRTSDGDSPHRTNNGGNSQKSYSPIRVEPSPERKVLIKNRHTLNYPTEVSKDTQKKSRLQSKATEESLRQKDGSVSDSQMPKQKLPIHLRLGSNTNHHSSQSRVGDRRRKSTSPSKPAVTSSTSAVSSSVSVGERSTSSKSRQAIKINEGMMSIKNFLSKQNNDLLTTNNLITGKTITDENQLDEKIARIRVMNVALLKRKSEIDREQEA